MQISVKIPLSIGDDVLGGGANSLLYVDAGQNLTSSAGATWDGQAARFSNAATNTPQLTLRSSDEADGSLGGLTMTVGTGWGVILGTRKGQKLLTFEGLDGSINHYLTSGFAYLGLGSDGADSGLRIGGADKLNTIFQLGGDLCLTTNGGAVTLGAGVSAKNVRVGTDGTNALLGFFGATPVAKPAVSGSRGGNAAVASLLAGLAALGAITDSTTA